jgi:hypothetical protein
MAALSLFVFKIGRNALILSFLGFYLLQISLRAYIMRWFLPPEALILGTLTSAPFFLFVFYMITDPKTSPSTVRGQVWLAFALTAVDLYLHRLASLYTFFYAAFIVAAVRFVYLHLKRCFSKGFTTFLQQGVLHRQVQKSIALLGCIGLLIVGIYRGWIHPTVKIYELDFKLDQVPAVVSGIHATPNQEILRQVDPRVQHIAKWLLSAGDAVAAGDYDNDGLLDLFLTNPLKGERERNSLYYNLGQFRFQRVEVPALKAISHDPKTYGIVSSAIFADYDNDGDQDLLLTVGYGKPILLRNLLDETGAATFEDVTRAAGLDEHTISLAATFFDFDRDGWLDLFITNSLNPYLEEYDAPRPLNIFQLPQPEYPGDRRMFPFMHSSWDNASNGGLNLLYRNSGARFEKMDIGIMGMPETHWSIAVGTGDLNQDGWTDLYIANDFGPDDLYLNVQGQSFQRVQGHIFGAMGLDTYKGMNSSLGDIDRNGYLDIYVSNVHVPLQAEGSLLWMTYPVEGDNFIPEFGDEATQRGALNEHRFGWGAAMGDLNNDGWLDIIQVNGMIDDTLDKRFTKCPTYWYVNEKLMRSGPEIHTYADMWGDLRGYCINGWESNRIYLSRGSLKKLQFVDVASQMGWAKETPSRGALIADLDNDGDLDVGVTHLYAPFSLYRNTLYEAPGSETITNKRHWVGLILKGNGLTCNRDAAGSQIKISYQEHGSAVQQMREIQILNAFAAQGDHRAHFGLGDYAGLVDIEISWCGAESQQYEKLQVDRYHSIIQPMPKVNR